MGAFLIVKKNFSKFSVQNSLNSFKKQGFIEYRHYDLQQWELFLFPKQLSNSFQCVEDKDYSLFIIGSLIYKNKSIKDTLSALLLDIKQRKNIYENLVGNFFIILYNKTSYNITFFTDILGLQRVYSYYDNSVLSNSFISIIDGATSLLTLNRDAIVETMCTGFISGNETIIKEIDRYYPPLSETKRKEFFEDFSIYKSKKESTTKQIEALDQFFEGIKPFSNSLKIDSGITGGFDSRLLFAMLKRHFPLSNIQLHSHSRKIINDEFKIGKKIAEDFSVRFITIPVSDIEDSDDHFIQKTMDEGFYFYDGQIITHAFWHEEFNTLNYRKRILSDCFIGFHGIGGEQYRNLERIIGKLSIYDWIKYKLIRKTSGKIFTKKAIEDKIIERIYNSVSHKIKINNNRIGLLELKRFANEIYIPSNRGVRCNMENKLTYFFCPYADPVVSRAAYGIVPFLGISLNYQAELINQIDPTLAREKSDYGFDFLRGEPFYNYALLTLGENFIPSSLWLMIQDKIKKRSNKWLILSKKSGYINSLIEVVKNYDLDINVEEVISKPDTGPLIWQLGYFLMAYQNKLK